MFVNIVDLFIFFKVCCSLEKEGVKFSKFNWGWSMRFRKWYLSRVVWNGVVRVVWRYYCWGCREVFYLLWMF